MKNKVSDYLKASGKSDFDLDMTNEEIKNENIQLLLDSDIIVVFKNFEFVNGPMIKIMFFYLGIVIKQLFKLCVILCFVSVFVF